MEGTVSNRIEHAYNIEYYFERRRYARLDVSNGMYTWLLYRRAGTQEWQAYGDPWNKVRLNQQELSEALAHIRWLLVQVGDTVRIGTGARGVVQSKVEWTGGTSQEGVTILFRDINQVHFVPNSAIVEIE
jgi:hypothetical protein